MTATTSPDTHYADSIYTLGGRGYGESGEGIQEGENVTGVMDRAGFLKPATLAPLAALVPVAAGDPMADAGPRLAPIGRHQAVVVEGQPVAVVGERYQLLQHRSAFGIADALVEAGRASVQAVGSLHNGALLWANLKVGADVVRGLNGREDEVDGSLFISHGIDGRHALAAAMHATNLSCNNQFGSMQGKVDMRLKHTRRLEERLEVAGNLLRHGETAFRETIEVARELANEPMTADEFEAFVRELFAATRKEAVTDAAKAQRDRDAAELLEYFGEGAGNVGASAWDGFNSVTDWLDHRYARLDESKQTRERLERHTSSVLLGASRKVKQQAVRILRAR